MSEKHSRYGSAYRRFGYYWGLGVEHETYVATSQTRVVRAFDAAALKPERYSVNYYAAYRPDALARALQATLDVCGSMVVPILMNSHSFRDCDIFGEHKSTYDRIPKLNTRFCGETLEVWACKYSKWLKDAYGTVYVWDGDTVEFMTQDFYKATVAGVIQELMSAEERFVAELQKLPKQGLLAGYGPLRLSAPTNPGWATYLTNGRAVSMFNNGTIHVNVTLPTRLGYNRQPLWFSDFVERHRRLARLVQWLEPLWIAAYGSGDPFSQFDVSGSVAAAGSQRLAVSRYIGVGTFDTSTMPRGKILQIQKSAAGPLPWYSWLHARTMYAPLDVIGLDINFNKHWAHGLELRFFDQLPLADLEVVLRQVVVLMDIAQERGRIIPDPRTCPQWSAAAASALLDGPAWRITPEQMNVICVALGIVDCAKEPLFATDALSWLFDSALVRRRDACWRSMIGR
jgi:hypothetical protein